MDEITIWGIHAGKKGDAETLFKKHDVVAIGWHELGSFADLASREDFKKKYSEIFPAKSKGHVATSAGQLYRFTHEMNVGDLIVFPSREEREVLIGEIVGDYQHKPEVNQEYPNQRKVNWVKTVPRTYFSQGALFEMGSAMSLFQIRNYADEVLAALEGVELELVIDDETVGLVAEDIENQTRDFILKQLERNLKGIPLEEFIVHLLITMGYRARLTKKNEPSVDIIAHKDKLGFEPPIIKVQVKSSPGKIGDKDVSALYGKVDNNEYGLLISLGEYTSASWTFAMGKSNLRLIDGTELVDLIIEHYDLFNSRYKGIIPLKEVFIPQALDHDDE
ncbi:MAG: restriction endonuclease [Chloroflexi bacterium]|nr:restriction endonuclease [Chloroflexota bacterium]